MAKIPTFFEAFQSIRAREFSVGKSTLYSMLYSAVIASATLLTWEWIQLSANSICVDKTAQQASFW